MKFMQNTFKKFVPVVISTSELEKPEQSNNMIIKNNRLYKVIINGHNGHHKVYEVKKLESVN